MIFVSDTVAILEILVTIRAPTVHLDLSIKSVLGETCYKALKEQQILEYMNNFLLDS